MSFSSIREESEESSFELAMRRQAVSNSSSMADGTQLRVDVMDNSKSQSAERESRKQHQLS